MGGLDVKTTGAREPDVASRGTSRESGALPGWAAFRA